MDRLAKNTTENMDREYEFYVKHDSIPVEQIRTILKHRKMSEDKLTEFVNKVLDSRKKVRKNVNGFMKIIEENYLSNNIPKIIEKANKFAKSRTLSPIERDAIIALAMKGDANAAFNPFGDMKETEMAKFMGVDAPSGQVLNLQNKDFAPLNDIVKLYEMNRALHADVKNQLSLYRNCAPEALTGKFDRNKHNVSTHVHPVIVAMFLPKIEALERRMLYTNFGRVVVQRSLPYIDKNVRLHDNILNGELESEWEMVCDVLRDPNALALFSEDSPITNMAKRFRIQIELWQNVLQLRQGRYYASSYDKDGINGFMNVLSTYDWTFFDSPDMFHVQDEGTVLRKLLNVFSYRPTFVQLQSIPTHTSYVDIGRTTFLEIPIINVRLPSSLAAVPIRSVHLKDALQQADYMWDKREPVLKNKLVMYSRDIVFFYINRRFQAPNLVNLNLKFRYSSVPMQSWNVGQSMINETPLNYDDVIRIGEQHFELTSVVALFKPAVDGHISVGSTAIVCKREPAKAPNYFIYNPLLGGYMNERDGKYGPPHDPISGLREYAAPGSDIENFRDLSRKFGTIFMYVKC